MEQEVVPQESQTIAVRRAERLAEKIRLTKEKFGARAWWSNQLSEITILLFLLALNLYLVFPFFNQEVSQVPFSGPAIPLFAKLLEIFGFTFSEAIRIVYVIFFLIFPFSFYVFIKRLTERKIAAFLATLFVSLPIFPFAKTRVEELFIFGDGSHLASLSIVPFALFGLLSFLRMGGAKNLIMASLSSTFVLLISPFGFLTYLIFASITAFSELLLGKGRQKIVRLVLVFIFSAGLSAFWYNPGFSFWMITGELGTEIRSMVARLIPISFFVLPILGTFGYLLFDRKPDLQPVFLASFYTIAFAIILWAGSGLFPSQPNRYGSEFGISLSFLLAIAILRLSGLTLKVNEYLPTVTLSSIAIALTLAIILGRTFEVVSEEKVLGLWTGVEKAGIWVARDKFGGIYSIFGYFITAISLITLGFFGYKYGRTEQAEGNG